MAAVRLWRSVVICGLALLLVAASPAAADVKLASILGENMVLQQGAKVPIWGTADPAEKVTVTICGKEATVAADANGKWRVTIAPLAAGGPFEMTVKGKNTIALKNVLVGEVWVCSGQSNMAMALRPCNNAQEEIAKANSPEIRLFSVARKTSGEPLDAVGGQWVECSPKTVGGFSAVGYFFGRKLHQELKVPIGLINTSWGGTPADAWTSRPAFEAVPELKPILEHWDQIVADHPAAVQKFKEVQLPKLKEALQKATEALKEAQQLPDPTARSEAVAKARRQVHLTRRRMGGPTGPVSPHRPANLYNGMIAPLIPLAIKGAIWYQGESNAGRSYQYRKLFPTMIESWRKGWGQGDFAFYWVQLANFRGVVPEPAESGWAELREAQTMTLSLPNTGEAVIIDIGEARDIHPRNKQDVGLRLALNALALTYGKKIVYSGPRFDSMKVEGAKARVKFKQVGAGLVAKPFADPVTVNGPTLAKRFGIAITPELRPKTDVLGFAVAGEDKKFVWADEATIEGDCVVVSSTKVAKPVAVRYAWGNNPVCNLSNKEGLPACPFRTDEWPGVTAPKE